MNFKKFGEFYVKNDNQITLSLIFLLYTNSILYNNKKS